MGKGRANKRKTKTSGKVLVRKRPVDSSDEDVSSESDAPLISSAGHTHNPEICSESEVFHRLGTRLNSTAGTSMSDGALHSTVPPVRSNVQPGSRVTGSTLGIPHTSTENNGQLHRSPAPHEFPGARSTRSPGASRQGRQSQMGEGPSQQSESLLHDAVNMMVSCMQQSNERMLSCMQQSNDQMSCFMQQNNRQLSSCMERMTNAISESNQQVTTLIHENMQMTRKMMEKLAHPADGASSTPASNTRQKTVASSQPASTARSEQLVQGDNGSSSESSTQTDDEISMATERLTNIRSRQHSEAVKLPAFTGKDSWKIWYARFKTIAEMSGWDEKRRLRELLPKLQGTAGEYVYGDLQPHILRNYNRLIEELENRFRTIETKKTYQAQFNRRTQKPGEKVEDYASEIKRLYDKAYGNRDPITRQEDLLRKFLDGLIDDQTRLQVEYHKEPGNIDQAVRDVVNFQEAKRRPAIHEQNERRSTRAVRVSGEITECETSDDEIEASKMKSTPKTKKKVKKGRARKALNNNACQAKPEVKQDNKLGKKTEDSAIKSEVQQLREKLERLEKQQLQRGTKEMSIKFEPNKTQADSTFQKGPEMFRSKANVECYRCHNYGHYARECPTQSGQVMNQPTSAPSFETSLRPYGGTPYCNQTGTSQLSAVAGPFIPQGSTMNLGGQTEPAQQTQNLN